MVANSLGGGSLWYQKDCGTVQTVLLGAVRAHVPAQQAAKQSFSYKFIDGEMQAGRNSICFCLTGVL
jgi:hypothetical protein